MGFHSDRPCIFSDFSVHNVPFTIVNQSMVARAKEDQKLSWKSINFRCYVHITRGNHADYTEELNVVSITERTIQIFRIVSFHNAKKLVRPILVRRQYKSVRNATCEGFVQIRQDFSLAFLFLF